MKWKTFYQVFFNPLKSLAVFGSLMALISLASFGYM